MSHAYDPPSGSHTTKIPPGVRAFRIAPPAFGLEWTEVVRDLDRCQPASKSEHCVARAVDGFKDKAHSLVPINEGRAFFEWCVKHAHDLGIQSVIFNRRVWGFGDETERHYSGPSPHTDHVHTGLNKWAAANLTVEMVRSKLPGGVGVSKQDVIEALNEFGKAADGSTWASRLDRDTDAIKPLLDIAKGIADGSIQVVCKNAGAGGGITEAQVQAACERALAKLKLSIG